MDEELSDYLKKFKAYENTDDETKYSLYVHGYWLPHLQQLVDRGVLKKGKETKL